MTSSPERVAGFVPRQLSAPPSAAAVAQRREALTLGYAEGWSLGLREAAAAAEADRAAAQAAEHERSRRAAAALAGAAAALDRAAGTLAARSLPVLEAESDAVLAAAVELAEALVGHHLATTLDPAREALERALAPLPAGRVVTVRMSPRDLAALGAVDGDTVATAGSDVRFVADPALAAGDAVAVTPDTTVDARLRAALERARAVLQP